MPEEAKAALREMIMISFPERAMCGLAGASIVQTLARDRDKALPCLIDVYRHGLTTSPSFWGRKTPTPADGMWVLATIREVDPDTATKLYEDLADRTPAPEREWIVAQLLIMGHAEHLDELLRMVNSYAPLTASNRERDLISVSLDAISRVHARAALPVVERLRGRGETDNGRMPVWIAQLGEDLPSLEREARGPQWPIALRALRRMGATSTLKKLAADPDYTYRATAASTLNGPIL